MQGFGGRLARHCCAGNRLFLQGEIGSGKTTLVRGFLTGLGYQGLVKSPTYTLVEPYQIDDLEIFHLDLYRLNSPDEVFSIGIQDYFSPTAICLVEWPEKAGTLLAPADLHIVIQYKADHRALQLSPGTAAGIAILQAL